MQRCIMDRLPVHCRATNRQNPHSLIPVGNLKSPTSLTLMYLNCWTGVNQHKHRANMQTPHRKAQKSPNLNQEPSRCEATVLTTEPPSTLSQKYPFYTPPQHFYYISLLFFASGTSQSCDYQVFDFTLTDLTGAMIRFSHPLMPKQVRESAHLSWPKSIQHVLLSK